MKFFTLETLEHSRRSPVACRASHCLLAGTQEAEGKRSLHASTKHRACEWLFDKNSMREMQRTSGTPAACALLITHLQYSAVRSIADARGQQWQLAYALSFHTWSGLFSSREHQAQEPDTHRQQARFQNPSPASGSSLTPA